MREREREMCGEGEVQKFITDLTCEGKGDVEEEDQIHSYLPNSPV